ncbi:MAG: formylglycine-generating enzyme family protein [Bacteroidales bacterium]|nr:formylglycine-generating enzyme family protein [Bacteroidales bacterium]
MKKTCFIIMPFNEYMDKICKLTLKRALNSLGYSLITLAEHHGPGSITEEIIHNLFSNELIICDITELNPNVLYELGIAHTVSNKVITICNERKKDLIPFDLIPFYITFYNDDEKLIRETLSDQITKTIIDIDNWTSRPNNPVQVHTPIKYKVPLEEQSKLEGEIVNLQNEITALNEKFDNPSIGAGNIIPAGEFIMGNDSQGKSNEKPSHKVYTGGFLMDNYPVTNELYRRFILKNPDWRKENCNHIHYYLWQWDKNNYPREKREHPVVWINWFAAASYCNWRSLDNKLTPCYNRDFECNFEADGYRLPTEAEYEKAIKSGADTVYPWGKTINPSNANYNRFVGDTTYVGKYRPNKYQIFDLVGNVKEWCNDWYKSNIYTKNIRFNPKGPDSGKFKVFRSGSFASDDEELKCFKRSHISPDNTNPDFGFRCVKKL